MKCKYCDEQPVWNIRYMEPEASIALQGGVMCRTHAAKIFKEISPLSNTQIETWDQTIIPLFIRNLN